MGGIRTPRSVKGAQALCERYAEIEDCIALAEADRNAAIAAANTLADGIQEPLIAERAQIAEKLEPWWNASSEELTEGKRKSIELGGCLVGTVAGKVSLEVPKDQKAAKEALGKTKWGKTLLRTTVSLDKRAIAKALDGRNGGALKELGFAEVPGEDTFFVKRAEQGGTRGARA
tara:strand:+ start:7 stop:528 length:522 start_codon:yes stop_codon:yes gene_type:complete